MPGKLVHSGNNFDTYPVRGNNCCMGAPGPGTDWNDNLYFNGSVVAGSEGSGVTAN